MKRKNIDAMREFRLWIGQIVVPGLTVAASALAIPEVRQAIAAKTKDVKMSIDRKIKRKENEAQ